MDTTHVTVLYSFLPDASVFGIEPENVGGGLVFEVKNTLYLKILRL